MSRNNNPKKKKRDLFGTGMRSAWPWMERSGGGDGQQYSTSMVASGALLSLLRWLRTCRCRSSCRRRCLSVSCERPPAFPAAAAADPATKSAATSASATKHALAAAMDSLALPSPSSRATETAARGTAGKLKKKEGEGTREAERRGEETGEGGLKNPPVGVSFLLCFGWRAARSRPGLRSVASRHHSRGGWGEVVRRDPASQRCEFATHSDSDPHRWVGLS